MTISIVGTLMAKFIVAYKNALSDEQCDQMIKKFESFPDKAYGRTGDGVDVTKKDSMDCFISSHKEWQQECNTIALAVLKATVQYARQFPMLLTGAISPSMPDAKTKKLRTIQHQDIEKMPDQDIEFLVKNIYNLDNINLQRYTKGKGGYHHWHSEHFPHPTDPAQKSLHRVLLWLVYLNDIEEGGETEFFYQNLKMKPTKGSLILAPVNFSYTHRGCVPVSNDKYVLASWLMYKPANQLYPNK